MSNATPSSPAIQTIVVYVDGGVIQSIAATGPVRVIVLDADVQGNYEDRILVINDQKVIVSDRGDVEIDAAYVSSVSDQLELAVSQ
jgi:hypothetical protein